MLSYQHGYHAGNPADVLKHTVLCNVLDYLRQKNKPFYCHDTHAGRGLYALDSMEAKKTGEYLQGISEIWSRFDAPAALQPYLDAVAACNGGSRKNALKRYPGSPVLMQKMLRTGDRLGCTEMHPQEYLALGSVLPKHRKVKVTREDGYTAVLAAMPPIERRGLVLLDPSYELPGDDKAVVEAVRESLKRFAQGTYLVWYPLVNAARTRDLMYKAEKLVSHDLLLIELRTANPVGAKGMYGSGMLVYNPPWPLEQQMREVLPWLVERLAPEQGSWRVEWLRPQS